MHRETSKQWTKIKWVKYSGSVGVIIFFVIVYMASLCAPTFSIWENAYSDLGTQLSGCPYIFNFALMFLIFPLMGIFSLYLIEKAIDKTQTVGASFILQASIFIALIGLFPKGTKPHDFIALWFFISYFIGILIWSLSEKTPYKTIGIVLFLLFLLGFIIPFPSVAVAETYALILIFTFTLSVVFKDDI